MAAEPGAAPATDVASAPRILLVEDNPVNREVAIGMLESLGCSTEAVDNGRVAIDAMNGPASMRCSWIARCRSWTG